MSALKTRKIGIDTAAKGAFNISVHVELNPSISQISIFIVFVLLKPSLPAHSSY